MLSRPPQGDSKTGGNGVRTEKGFWKGCQRIDGFFRIRNASSLGTLDWKRRKLHCLCVCLIYEHQATQGEQDLGRYDFPRGSRFTWKHAIEYLVLISAVAAIIHPAY